MALFKVTVWNKKHEPFTFHIKARGFEHSEKKAEEVLYKIKKLTNCSQGFEKSNNSLKTFMNVQDEKSFIKEKEILKMVYTNEVHFNELKQHIVNGYQMVLKI